MWFVWVEDALPLHNFNDHGGVQDFCGVRVDFHCSEDGPFIETAIHNPADENNSASTFRSVRNERINWHISSHSAISTYAGARQQAL